MTYNAQGIGTDGLRDEVEALLAGASPGESLAPVVRSLVEYAICSSVTVLDLVGARAAAERALHQGATAGQLHEVLALVSGLGVHTLMEGSRDLADLLTSRGEKLPEVDADRAELRERLLGGAASYWDVFEAHVPGFLDVLLRLSPEAFAGFISYGAIPARTRQLRPVVKEIISVAMDALPNHRYMPGLRLHLGNALQLGAGRTEIREAIDLASSAPEPPGVA
jgi:alkylhydroperoxidase/carboxymuconolactone decarboxylase family protein YurZ